MSHVCVLCGRGKEACEYCYREGEVDWEAMCDCGLYDFDHHLTNCGDRKDHRWVVAVTHESAKEKL